MTIKHLYPTSAPSLSLNFESSGVADSRISCTRNSTGTYADLGTGFIKTATANEARVGRDGLLVEEARTNLTLHSEDFTNAAWSHGQETLHSANQAVAPDGTTTADLLYPNSSGYSRSIFQNYNNANGTYTASVFVKAAGVNFVHVGNAQGNARAWFNLSSGTKGTADATITDYGIVAYPNGWYRCNVSTDNTTARYFYIGPADADNSTYVTASGTNGIYVWGAQFEEGSFPTSYIPTSGSTVTRNKDEVEITGTNFSDWYSTGGEGSLVTTANGAVAGTSNNFNIVYLGGGASSGNNRISSTIGSTFTAFAQTTSLGVSIAGAVYTSNVDGKGAFGYKSGDSALYVDGSSVGTSSGTTIPTTTVNRMYIGMNRNRTSQINGDISRIAYYLTRLSNTQLQALTQ